MGKRKVQVVLTLMPGAEPWIRVTHDRGWFKVPGNATALEVFEGALAHWANTRRRILSGEVYVRVPLSLWQAFVATGIPPLPVEINEEL